MINSFINYLLLNIKRFTKETSVIYKNCKQRSLFVCGDKTKKITDELSKDIYNLLSAEENFLRTKLSSA